MPLTLKIFIFSSLISFFHLFLFVDLTHKILTAELFFLLGEFGKFIFSTFLLYLSFSWKKTFLLPIVIFHNLIFFLYYYYEKKFGIYIDCDIVFAVFETSYGEAKEFISGDFALLSMALISSLILLFFLVFVGVRNGGVLISAISFICFVVTLNVDVFIDKNQRPLNSLNCSYQYLKDRFDINKSFLNRATVIDDRTIKFPDISQNQKVVLVIGESARADHFSLNGYERKTNPNLEIIENLISYKSARSCSSTTRVAVPCLLTRATEENLDSIYKEKSFMDFFNQAGFETTWLSMNDSTGFYNNLTTSFAEESSITDFRNDLEQDYDIANDLLLLEKFKTHYDHTKPQFIVLHMRGSHWKYDNRYTEEFKKFQPICDREYPTDCPKEHLINSYDNSILMTDYVISEVIKTIQNDNALLIFTSDHGESLGEGGKFTHNDDEATEQREVPLIIWASDKYKEQNKSIRDFDTSKPISHDYIFHSILGCSGFESRVIDQPKNLCNLKNTDKE